MPTVFEVARYFLSKSVPNTPWAITHLKLQKLAYYAQGWYLAFTGNVLFNERLEAWVHGPVSPDLFHKYRRFGHNEIPQEDFPDSRSIFTKKQLEVLDAVWEAYGEYSGKFLEELTHQELPWLEARSNLDSNDYSNEVILVDTIRSYFRNQLGDE